MNQLAGAGVILLDGATGSNLTKAGMPKGVSTELWVLEHPDILANLQKAYVEAGSQIVYAPTLVKQIEISGLWKRKRGGGAECTPGGHFEKSACRNRCA